MQSCGFALGLSFCNKTGLLYITDAYKGLLAVAPDGGLAFPVGMIVSDFAPPPIKFLIGLDIDQGSGVVYFSQTSTNYLLRDVDALVRSNDATGSVYKYDPRTKQVTKLMDNLSVAAGVALSEDGSFLLVSEFVGRRVTRLWLKGPKANKAEKFAEHECGYPDNIKRISKGEFWVAVTNVEQNTKTRTVYRVYESLGIKYSEGAEVLQVVNLTPVFGVEAISEVQEVDGVLHTGSLHGSTAAVKL